MAELPPLPPASPPSPISYATPAAPITLPAITYVVATVGALIICVTVLLLAVIFLGRAGVFIFSWNGLRVIGSTWLTWAVLGFSILAGVASFQGTLRKARQKIAKKSRRSAEKGGWGY